jgi:tetratricopeptide (TPR) repeat protein
MMVFMLTCKTRPPDILIEPEVIVYRRHRGMIKNVKLITSRIKNRRRSILKKTSKRYSKEKFPGKEKKRQKEYISGSLPQKIVFTLNDSVSSDSSFNKKMGSVAEFLSNTSKIFFNSIIIILILIIVLGFIKQTNRKYIIIKPFDISKKLEESGYTGEIIARKLLDHFTEIRKEIKNAEIFVPSWEQSELDIKVPGADISLRSLINHIKKLFGFKTPYINGEIINYNDSFKLVVRGDGILPKTLECNLTNLDEKLSDSAKYILESINPYVLAMYYYTLKSKENDETKKKELLDMCLYILKKNNYFKDENSKTMARGYNLHAIIYMFEYKNNEMAEQYFKKAIKLDPDFSYPHFYLAKILEGKKQFEKAKKEYKNVIRKDRGGKLKKLANEYIDRINKYNIQKK